jgi:serine/threonine protein kinase/ABC-type nitrate/sulfonate/bicarbonate transport system substrate-binding protein
MRLGPYELVRQIGAGGMGEVWAAHRAATGPREVLAVKRLPKQLAKDPTYRQILLDEARMSMLLRHRNIVHVFDAGEADGEAYIAMEFVQGLDLSRLRKLLDQTGEALSPTAVAFVFGAVLEGLDYAHNLQKDGKPISLVHRDVSPHNVMLSTRGEVKLTDFGVARLSSEDTTGTHVKGKARYMPPEQLRGESRSPKVDLFAAGAVLHELLDGSVFRGEAIDDARLLGMAIDGVVPEPRRTLTSFRELEQLRRGLLQTDPKKRIPTAQAALELLHRWSGYKNAAAEVGDLVRRYLDLQVSLERDPTQTALAQSMSSPPNKDELVIPANLDALADPWGEPVHTGPDLLLRTSSEGESEFDFQLEDELPPAAHKRGVWDESPRDDESSARPGARTRPSSRPDRGPPATGGHRTLEGVEDDTEPKLQLDLPQASFVRHVATSPNPTVPPGRGPKLVGIGLLAVGLGIGGWFAVDWIQKSRASKPPREPELAETGLRKARVIGDASTSSAGFRQRHMDRLVSEDILYSYVRVAKSTAGDPLAALASGEAEFALTTLDRVLLERAGARDPNTLGKIVAVVNVSLGDDALVLDTVEFPRLRSLADLAAVVGNAKLEPALAHAGGTPSEYLDLRLDALLVGLEPAKLGHVGELAQIQAVYDALLADSSVRTGPKREGPQIVAAWLREPWLSKAVDAGMTVAISTRDLPAATIDVLVASPRMVAEHPELVEAVVGAYYQGIVAQQADQTELLTTVARDLGLTADEAARALAGSCLLDALGAEAWLVAQGPGADVASTPLLAEAIRATWETLRSHAKVSGSAPSLASLIDPRATTAAAAIERKLPVQDLHGSLAQCLARAKPTSSSAQALGELELPTGQTAWFVPGEATLTDAGKLALAELAARLRAFNPASVSAEVTGLGDPSRSIGQARALAVVEHLHAAGVTLQLRTRGVAGGQPEPDARSIRLALSRTY